jgi:hypothetical protein
MTKLKIGAVEDDKPVTLAVKLPARIHRDLIIYAEVLKRESGKPVDPTSLIVAMLTRFMATDRGFMRARRRLHQGKENG